MKTRATSFLLAILAVVSLVLPALAEAPDDLQEGILEEASAESEEITEETEEKEKEESAILLDGEPVQSMEYEILGGVCYVTVRSFVSMLDPEAVVEEEDGTVSVSATTVTRVISLDGEEAEAEPDQDAAEPEGGEEGDAESSEAGESTQIPEGVENAADVVRADLNLLAAIGGAYFTANGRYLWVDGGLIDLNGSAAAPVRQLARVFNLTVDYDGETGQILLDRQEGAEPYLTSGDDVYDSDTLYWLSHIIYCESGNQPLTGKVAVGNVVMNRVADPRFPDTIYDVLFQKNQFGPASSGSIYRDPNWDSVIAAKLVMDGASVAPDALYFNGAKARGGVARTKTYITTIGDHAFYK